MRGFVVLLLAAGAGLFPWRSVAAQAQLPPGTAGVTAADSLALATLRPGDRLLLDLGAAGRLEGLYLSRDSASLELEVAPGGDRRAVDLSGIARIFERGHSTQRGVWIGLMSGFATGAVLGIGLSAVDCDPYDGDNCRTWQVAAAYGGLGALGGAVIGGVVGRLIPAWRLLIPG